MTQNETIVYKGWQRRTLERNFQQVKIEVEESTKDGRESGRWRSENKAENLS